MTGNLYFSAGGEPKPLGRIVEVPEIVMGDEDFEQEMLEFQYPEEMTFTATTIINRNLIRLLIGKKEDIPNNWLKMHGYRMRRKCHGHRQRNRNKSHSNGRAIPD